MSNENEVEVVEAEEVEETKQESETTEVETAEGEDKPVEKPVESLADRKARLERQLSQTNKKLGLDISKPEKKSSKSDDFDYGEKAFLVANGVKSKDEMNLARDYVKNTGKTLDEVLESKYFQSELKEMRELAQTKEATPTGKRSGGVPTDSVEYWMAKPIEDVPQEMRIKVVNAKLKQNENKGGFYNS